MNYENTKSYELITLLDKSRINIKNKYKYLYLFKLKYMIYEFKINRKIKKLNNKEKIELFIQLFKEYLYLQDIIKDNNIDAKSEFEEYMINNIIIGNIYYSINNPVLCVKIEYNIEDGNYCIYLDTSKYNINTTGFNITEQNLKNEEKCKVFNLILNIFFNDILYIMISIFGLYIK